jgi:hypothetical protein
MKLPLLALTALLVAASPALRAASSAPAAKPATPAYPLTTCVVSGEKLGGMGDAFEYIHKEAGKPDRRVLFCCEGCVDDFKKEPAKYLAKLDEAAKAAGKGK